VHKAPISPAPVLKKDSAYARLKEIASGIRAEEPKLTEAQAFVRAFNQNRELAVKAKTEQAFA
jgi:hypothetical protein